MKLLKTDSVQRCILCHCLNNLKDLAELASGNMPILCLRLLEPNLRGTDG